MTVILFTCGAQVSLGSFLPSLVMQQIADRPPSDRTSHEKVIVNAVNQP
jgi:hypothetical protein